MLPACLRITRPVHPQQRAECHVSQLKPTNDPWSIVVKLCLSVTSFAKKSAAQMPPPPFGRRRLAAAAAAAPGGRGATYDLDGPDSFWPELLTVVVTGQKKLWALRVCLHHFAFCVFIFCQKIFNIWSIKYRLITKLITDLVCKLRDESNKPN